MLVLDQQILYFEEEERESQPLAMVSGLIRWELSYQRTVEILFQCTGTNRL